MTGFLHLYFLYLLLVIYFGKKILEMQLVFTEMDNHNVAGVQFLRTCIAVYKYIMMYCCLDINEI